MCCREIKDPSCHSQMLVESAPSNPLLQSFTTTKRHSKSRNTCTNTINSKGRKLQGAIQAHAYASIQLKTLSKDSQCSGRALKVWKLYTAKLRVIRVHALD